MALSNRKMVSFLEEWIDGTSIQRTPAEDVGEENAGPNIGFAWNLYQQTLNLFAKLLPLIPGGNNRRQPKIVLKETLGKFFLWGDGFSDGRLEAVLEESEDLKASIISELAAIGRILISDFMKQCDDTGHDIQQQTQELDVLLEKAKLLLVLNSENESESDNGSESESENESGSSGICKTQQLARSLQTFVLCLMDFLPSMTRTLSNAQQEPSEKSTSHLVEFTVSGPAQPYVLNVLDRFALADTRLVQRLGEANWQRHTALRNVQIAETQSSLEDPELREVPKLAFAPISMFHDSGLGSSILVQSSYAATMVSHSSFMSSTTEQNNATLRVPRTPEEVSEGKSFTCSICKRLLHNIKNRIDWKRHVFSDLKPYICTFSGCKDELITFPTRKLWKDHEVDHRLDRSWACLECPQVFLIAEDWQLHLNEKHQINMTDQQLEVAIHAAERRIHRSYENEPCPLCREIPGISKRHFVNHVARHMEGISLAALPNDDSASDSEYDSETSDHDFKSFSVAKGNSKETDSTGLVRCGVRFGWTPIKLEIVFLYLDSRDRICGRLFDCAEDGELADYLYDGRIHVITSTRCPVEWDKIILDDHLAAMNPDDVKEYIRQPTAGEIRGQPGGSQIISLMEYEGENIDEETFHVRKFSEPDVSIIRSASTEKHPINSRHEIGILSRKATPTMFEAEDSDDEPIESRRGAQADTHIKMFTRNIGSTPENTINTENKLSNSRLETTAPSHQEKNMPGIAINQIQNQIVGQAQQDHVDMFQLQTYIFQEIQRQTNPDILTGWQANVLMAVRYGSVQQIVTQYRLSLSYGDQSNLTEICNVALQYEKETFEKSPNRITYQNKIRSKIAEIQQIRESKMGQPQHDLSGERYFSTSEKNIVKSNSIHPADSIHLDSEKQSHTNSLSSGSVRVKAPDGRLAKLYKDTINLYNFRDPSRDLYNPILPSILHKICIQEDKLRSWALQWANTAKGWNEIDENIDRAGLGDVVEGALTKIKDILVMTSPQWQAKYDGDGNVVTKKREELVMLEESLKEITAAVDTLYDVSRIYLD